MFEVGFSELVVIAVVALIVLGPERLPKAARMAGTFLRKARMSFESLKHEVERELEAEEVKKQLAEFKAAPAAIAAAIEQPFQQAQAALSDARDSVIADLSSADQPVATDEHAVQPGTLPQESSEQPAKAERVSLA
jgi:sec-independent protein translocase protein TatB